MDDALKCTHKGCAYVANSAKGLAIHRGRAHKRQIVHRAKSAKQPKTLSLHTRVMELSAECTKNGQLLLEVGRMLSALGTVVKGQ
jgi:hypothetical protein